MQLKIRILKFLRKTSLTFLLSLVIIYQSFSQEVVTIDSNGVARNSELTSQEKTNDTLNVFKRYKAEGVCGVVGDFVILEFDIDKSYLEFEQNGIDVNSIDRCEMIGKLMEDKLYVHHAIQDSIIISDAEIKP